jgi:hypothetical protein
VSLEIVDAGFRERFRELLGARRPTMWLASPFMTEPVAQWLAALPAAKHGDRRLLVAWAPRSIESGYLSAHAVDVLHRSGFVVRDLHRLHAKMIVAGTRAYLGSANLTSYAIDGVNTEIGVFADGADAARAKVLFAGWWEQAVPLTEQAIARSMRRQERLGNRRGWDVDHEAQPGYQPSQPKPVSPSAGHDDAIPASPASPPAIVHYWRRDTIAANLDLAGRHHNHFDSTSTIARDVQPGTRVYSVGWAASGGLRVLNAFTVTDVRKSRGEWRVSGTDATPLVFNRVLIGEDYARSVRIRNKRSAPTSYMAFSPIAYLSQRTADRLERLSARTVADRPEQLVWIKSQYYRHDGWTIAPGQEHWIGDPGERDQSGRRIYRKDGVPAGEPHYKAGDLIGLYFGTTRKVPLVVEVTGTPRFDPDCAQQHNDGGEPDAGERWPWVTPVKGRWRLPIEQAPDIDYLGIRGAIQWGRPHFRLKPKARRELLEAFRG